MATAEQVATQIKTYVATLTGIKESYDKPVGQIGTGQVVVIVYPPSGTNELVTPGERESLETYMLRVLIPLGDIARNVDVLLPYVDSVPNLLWYKLVNDNQWNNMIDTFERIDHVFVNPTIAGVEYIGVEFKVIRVKRHITLTA